IGHHDGAVLPSQRLCSSSALKRLPALNPVSIPPELVVITKTLLDQGILFEFGHRVPVSLVRVPQAAEFHGSLSNAGVLTETEVSVGSPRAWRGGTNSGPSRPLIKSNGAGSNRQQSSQGPPLPHWRGVPTAAPASKGGSRPTRQSRPSRSSPSIGGYAMY